MISFSSSAWVSSSSSCVVPVVAIGCRDLGATLAAGPQSLLRLKKHNLNPNPSSLYCCCANANSNSNSNCNANVNVNAEREKEEEVDYAVVSAINSQYNDILILDSPHSRVLLLDSTYNVHSVFMKEQLWTGSYWDEFASLPAIIPEGPIALFGLGGGTAAHLMLALWPSLQLHGWEIDEILIYQAREHLGLCDLEKHTESGGVLNVHIGDALSASSNVSGGYAGIVVDLFSSGGVLSQLQEVETWLQLNDKLMPNGRFMVNCGAATSATKGSCIWEENSTLEALCKAFPGQVNWKKMPKSEGENYLALTGALPDMTTWAAALPDRLGSGVVQWTSCFPS